MSVLTAVSAKGPGPSLPTIVPLTLGATALSEGPSGRAALRDVKRPNCVRGFSREESLSRRSDEDRKPVALQPRE